MGQILEVSYYNSFILAGGTTSSGSTNQNHKPGNYFLNH